MIRRFCDNCGVEITGYLTNRLLGEYGRIRVEVSRAVDGVWNGGDACEECIKRAVQAGHIKKAEPQPEVQP